MNTEAVDLAARMATRADVLHALAPLLPSDHLRDLARLAVAALALVADLRQRLALRDVELGELSLIHI